MNPAASTDILWPWDVACCTGASDDTAAMDPFRDIRSRGLLHAKGLAFLSIGMMACGAILLEAPNVRVLVLLGFGIWGFCRFYYYLFYVLENYAGRGRRYAGVLDALKYVVFRR